MRTRGKGGGRGGATRCNATTSQGKLEVNKRQTPKGLVDKRLKRRRRRRRRRRGGRWWRWWCGGGR